MAHDMELLTWIAQMLLLGYQLLLLGFIPALVLFVIHGCIREIRRAR